MEEDVNSVKKDNYQSCRKTEKPIRKLFRNGKKIPFKIHNKNKCDKNKNKIKTKKNISTSNVQFFIIVAWRRIKILSGGDNRRESDTDEMHLYRMYIFAYLQRFIFIDIFKTCKYTI